MIGEDLGTVLPEVTEGLERDEHARLGGALVHPRPDDPQQGYLPPGRYPRNALASISTHDLPTAAGFLTGEQVRVRAELGQLAGSVEDEHKKADARPGRAAGDAARRGPDRRGPIRTRRSWSPCTRALARTPCRLIVASLYDVLGELRQPNLPGTMDQYPNWRMPLTVSLEQIRTDPRVRQITEIMGVARPTRGMTQSTGRKVQR